MKRPYNFGRVQLTWGPYTIHGFAQDSSIEVDVDEDKVTKDTGADGEVCRVFSMVEGGSVTVMLQQSSSSNQDLSDAAERDRLNEDEVWPLQLQDTNGETVVFASEAWLTRQAPNGWAKAHGTRQWKFDCANLRQRIGGQGDSTGLSFGFDIGF